MIVGLDLSINSTGICLREGEKTPAYYLIVPKLSKRMVAINNMKSCSISHITYDKIKDNVNHNIRCISNKICEIIKENRAKIKYVVIEDVAYRARGNSLIDLTLLNGYVRCMLDELGVEYRTTTPTQWKKKLIGNGMANKETIIYKWAGKDPDNCRAMFNHSCKCDDVADSYFLSCA
jgi:Holliday junction resolvasome RuvABC endonuclease subunit